MPHEAKFFVYVHRRGDTGEVFYVGKGRGKRHLSACGRNVRWARVAAKHGFSAEIIHADLNEQDAFQREKAVIAAYRENGAPLVNMTDGGEGPAGRTFSPETKEKMRAAKLGRKLSPDHVAKLSASRRGRKWTEEQKSSLRGRVFSAEHRERIRLRATGRKMAFEVVEKVAALKRGVPLSAEHRAKIGAKSLGSGNANFCPTIYHFAHAEHGVRSCTQNALRHDFGMPHANLSKMIAGERRHVRGWRLLPIEASR